MYIACLVYIYMCICDSNTQDTKWNFLRLIATSNTLTAKNQRFENHLCPGIQRSECLFARRKQPTLLSVREAFVELNRSQNFGLCVICDACGTCDMCVICDACGTCDIVPYVMHVAHVRCVPYVVHVAHVTCVSYVMYVAHVTCHMWCMWHMWRVSYVTMWHMWRVCHMWCMWHMWRVPTSNRLQIA
jgi:hypothetical protein